MRISKASNHQTKTSPVSVTNKIYMECSGAESVPILVGFFLLLSFGLKSSKSEGRGFNQSIRLEKEYQFSIRDFKMRLKFLLYRCCCCSGQIQLFQNLAYSSMFVFLSCFYSFPHILVIFFCSEKSELLSQDLFRKAICASIAEL